MYDNTDCIGYIKLNFKQAQTELDDLNAMEIERIYLLQQFQGHNLGVMLLNKAKAIAAEYKCSYIWLGVWENNHQAIRFYRSNGFTAFSTHPFNFDGDMQTDILFKAMI